MEKHQIAPERITKPIQLLGAWLVGLLSIDAAFLVAATRMDPSSWQSGALTIAAIINVPIFIGALFLLQTKFRPELQEDSYYSTYLSSRTNELIKVPRNEAVFSELEKRIELIEKHSIENGKSELAGSTLADLSIGINVHLSNRNQLISELSSLGVIGFSEFGERVDPPKMMKVAVSESVPKNDLAEILRVAQRLGFTHYGFIEHFEEISEDVLFGAYGDSDVRVIIPA